MKKDSFEDNLTKIDAIIEELDSGNLSLGDSLKNYEKAMKLLTKSTDILNEAEGKIIKVREENGCIELEDDENV